MHIGIDASRTTLPQLTGTEYYSLHLIRALARIDSFNRYTLYYNDPPHKLLGGTNFSNRIVPARRLWTQVRLAAECLLHHPDVLFVPAHTIPIIRHHKMKTVVTIHDLGAEYLPQYHQFPQKLYLNRSTEFVARYATQIIAVSQSTKNDIMKKFGTDPDRISVVYEGVDHDRFKPIHDSKVIKAVCSKYSIPDNFILFVGTIQPRKNLLTLIDAFSHLVRQNDRLKLQLVLAGKKGWLSDGIYGRPSELGTENRVRFLDYVEENDLPHLYNAASVFILPSHYEGFGLPLLEAMACGCPVIASNSSSLPELIPSKQQLFETLSSESLSKLISTMLIDRTFREKSIMLGIEKAKQFTWEKCAQETLAIFRRICV